MMIAVINPNRLRKLNYVSTKKKTFGYYNGLYWKYIGKKIIGFRNGEKYYGFIFVTLHPDGRYRKTITHYDLYTSSIEEMAKSIIDHGHKEYQKVLK